MQTFMPVSKASTSSVQAVWVELTSYNSTGWIINATSSINGSPPFQRPPTPMLAHSGSSSVTTWKRAPIAYRLLFPSIRQRPLNSTSSIYTQTVSYPAMVSPKTLEYGRGISHCWYYKPMSNLVAAGYNLKVATSSMNRNMSICNTHRTNPILT